MFVLSIEGPNKFPTIYGAIMADDNKSNDAFTKYPNIIPAKKKN